MNIGTKNHMIFEKEQKDAHDLLPEPKPGEPYVYLVQEKLLQDNELNVKGKPDQVMIRGTNLNMECDKRSVLIVDKKPRYSQSYLYQLWGYAYLSKKDKLFEQYKPFNVYTGFAFKSIDEIYPFVESNELAFVNKVHEMRYAYSKMVEGQLPKVIYTDKCEKCHYRDKCSELFKNV
jgi:CRISPR/Cas system-associated exonuclease Cas4 (RecB family)